MSLGVCIGGSALGTPPPSPLVKWSWCRYPEPTHSTKSVSVAALSITEVEPNDTPSTAQPIPLGDGDEQSRDLDINGGLATNGGVDYYRLTVEKGDVLGMALLGGGVLDSTLAVTNSNGAEYLTNDDHRGIADVYPLTSPFPGGGDLRDSALTWIAPATGEYLVSVASWDASSSGPYTLEIRSRRPAIEEQSAPATQTFFLDFDGASINAAQLYGFGNNPANLSPLSSFLSPWGLTAADESALIDAIVGTVQENLADLRLPSLNGDRDADGIDGHTDFRILNSRDHADPFGLPNVTRLIIGGTVPELGIWTIGVAQSIDPGNFAQEETAVVLLDILSAPPPSRNSINSIPVDRSMRRVDAIGLVVGNIAVHEAGHTLGSWHTENSNAVRCIMDTGNVINIAGVGVDDVLGTADDDDVDFVTDAYESAERVATGDEPTAFRTAMALATGASGCATDADCDDGDFCNGSETCVAGRCQPGATTDCDDGDECTTDTCQPLTGCSSASIDCQHGGLILSARENTAKATAAVRQARIALIPRYPNTHTLSCCCVSDPLAPCCGNDTCELDEECTWCPSDCFRGSSFCGDEICAGATGGEDCFTCPADCRCAGGECRHGCCGDGICTDRRENASNCPVDCDPTFLPPVEGSCCGDDVCEGREDADNCAVDCEFCVADEDCDDGNDCTDNVCHVGRCQTTTNTGPCDDGLFCNGADACSNGICSIHAGDPCTGGPECTDACDEFADTCNLPAGTACTDDGNLCTDDECDGTGNCVSFGNSEPCDDGLFCTATDVCAGGTCVGGGAPCQTNEFCHEPTDTCPIAGNNVILRVAPGSESVAPGNTVTLTLDVANLEEAINGVQVLLGYDATLLTLVDIHPTDLGLPPPNEGWVQIDELDDNGNVIWAAVINGGSREIDHTVGTITLTAIAEGTTRIVFRPDEPPVLNKLTKSRDSLTLVPNLVGSGSIVIACDDGLFCNGLETFVGGSCQPGTDPCPGAYCDEAADRCRECVADTDCEDGDLCTTDHCDTQLSECVNDPIVPCCGNAVCEPSEDECTCSTDCGVPPATESNCTDGVDEDCDGQSDCDDLDCSGDPACPSEPVCGNGVCEGRGEDCFSCPGECRCTGADCSNACCGDGVCLNESASNCAVDCGG